MINGYQHMHVISSNSEKKLEDVEFLLMMLTLNMDISEVNMYYFLMM